MELRSTRRNYLKRGLVGAAGLALPLGALSGPIARIVSAESVESPRVERFSVPLPIPPVLEPVRTDDTTDYYELTQQEGTAEILPGLETSVWGYNGIFPGPTIEAQRGRPVVIRQRNELPVPVSTHLHGGMTPPESDGYPTDLILPIDGGSLSTYHEHASGPAWSFHRGSKEYTYPNEQRGTTLWYHDHRMDFTGPQVYKGLAGFYIIRDEIEDDLSLPDDEKDVPLMITDRTFKEDGSLFYPSLDPSLTGQPGVLPTFSNGMRGDTILVNGAPWPSMEVSNTRYRFRLLNASNARIYDLALDPSPPDGRSFVQVGSDGGLLEASLAHETIRISPAERFDVIVDFSHYPVGTQVTMKNMRGDGRTADILRFEIVREERDESTIPATLAPPQEFPDPEAAVATRRFQFLAGILGGMSTINMQTFDPARIDARPRLDSTELWEFSADPTHPIHMHLVHYKVISRDGGPPGPYDAGWKDTVFVPSGTVRVVAKFAGYRGKYVFHCHNLEHEDRMMMANFEVV